MMKPVPGTPTGISPRAPHLPELEDTSMADAGGCLTESANGLSAARRADQRSAEGWGAESVYWAKCAAIR